METKKQELIDLLNFAKDNYNVLMHYRTEYLVDEYLKSINSNSDCERRAIGSNEQAEKVCTCIDWRETPMINGRYICSICNKPIVQTD